MNLISLVQYRGFRTFSNSYVPNFIAPRKHNVDIIINFIKYKLKGYK